MKLSVTDSFFFRYISDFDLSTSYIYRELDIWNNNQFYEY